MLRGSSFTGDVIAVKRQGNVKPFGDLCSEIPLLGYLLASEMGVGGLILGSFNMKFKTFLSVPCGSI